MLRSSLTPAQLATLKSFVNATPALLSLWGSGTPVPIADALNDPANASYAGTVTLATIDKASLLVALRPAFATLFSPSISASVQAKWVEVKNDIRAVDSVAIDATAIALFDSAVTDGILTSAQAQACYMRGGSWAEVHFGAGASIRWEDVTVAMNS